MIFAFLFYQNDICILGYTRNMQHVTCLSISITILCNFQNYKHTIKSLQHSYCLFIMSIK